MSEFVWTGGAVRLAEPVADPLIRAQEWGRAEKDEYTVPFGPWSFTEHGLGEDRPTVAELPWVHRYGQGQNGTGSLYSALAVRVHADVAAKLGGPIVVTLLTPWTAAYPFASEGYLDEHYVCDKLGRGRNVHPDDRAAITELVRTLLGRWDL